MVTCPRCGRPAPRLITFRAAHRSSTQECPACAYPTQRVAGAMQSTMPEADQEWYKENERIVN